MSSEVIAPEKSEKIVQTLEEDDEFEDFQEENWPDDQDIKAQDQTKLWDEDWDDGDAEDDFAQRLKEELAKTRS